MTRRVVVTGVGLLSSVGIGTAGELGRRCWPARAASARSRTSTRRRSRRASRARSRASIRCSSSRRKTSRRWTSSSSSRSRPSQFAMDDARLRGHAGESPTRSASSSRRASAGSRTIEREHKELLNGGPRRISPFFIPGVHHQSGGRAGLDPLRRARAEPGDVHGLHGVGARDRRGVRDHPRGDADVMIAGGSEASITPMGVGGFAAMRALSTRNDEPARASRPFDKDRDGFVIGEGAGILDPRGARVRAARAAPRSTPRSPATACRATPIHLTAPARGRQRRGPVDADGAAQGRRHARARSTTSTRTARRRRSTTRPRRSP